MSSVERQCENDLNMIKRRNRFSHYLNNYAANKAFVAVHELFCSRRQSVLYLNDKKFCLDHWNSSESDIKLMIRHFNEIDAAKSIHSQHVLLGHIMK